jgi:RNase H-fold protein (predicted Holliday junction resolvase)
MNENEEQKLIPMTTEKETTRYEKLAEEIKDRFRALIEFTNEVRKTEKANRKELEKRIEEVEEQLLELVANQNGKKK